ncbi:MAG: signal peptide peptidase SppA [Candidatus Micrarchaeota archaeon]|nr:signal peptide peptidase SppA [Candidatus Micrarchaeota archaeon]
MKSNEILVVFALVLIGAMMFIAVLLAIYAVYVLATPRECVGLISVDGEISTKSQSGGLFGTPTIGSEDIVKQIEDAESRSDVKAVVFEVNSPGGSVVASKEIYEAVRSMKKPKVAYFREVAASGGYYISAPADYIVSEPDALTGSIGVIATFEDMSSLFSKLGVNYTIMKSGELKDMGSPSRPMTEKEREIMQVIINDIFGEFRRVVEEGRGDRLNKTKFEEILDARVLTGRQAKDVGLVDELGDKKEAIRVAAQFGNVKFTQEPDVCDMRSSNLIGDIFSSLGYGITYTVRELVGVNNVRQVGVSYT